MYKNENGKVILQNTYDSLTEEEQRDYIKLSCLNCINRINHISSGTMPSHFSCVYESGIKSIAGMINLYCRDHSSLPPLK